MNVMVPAWVNGKLTPVEKLKAHQDGLLHKAVSVFMICSTSILIQRRAMKKYHTPGLWANTCCTHPFWDEPALHCAKRRIKDELGITDCRPVFQDEIEYRADVDNGLTEHERVSVFSIHVETPPPMDLNPDEVMEVIEATATRLGAPLIAHGQNWHVHSDFGRLVFQDDHGLLDLPLPALLGAHQIQNAGAALAALRYLGADHSACEAAMTNAVWPARMQRLKTGPLVQSAPSAELWLDGGHNAAAGVALADVLAKLPKRPTHLICGMLNTKDVTGYMAPLAGQVDSLTAISIPDEINTLPAEDTAAAAAKVGLNSATAVSAAAALAGIVQQDPQARVLICGSLYLAGAILHENG